jgi:Zn-dependent protease
LYPIGGVARLERIPEEPRQELVIALAGPAVNVVIAAALGAGLLWVLGPEPVGESIQRLLGLAAAAAPDMTLPGQDFLTALGFVNVALVVFNMIPAFPMDGGRVLRALLAMRMDYARATRIAAGVGQAAAFGFALVGLMIGHLMLVVVAFFVWIGAGQEAAAVQLRVSLGKATVAGAMVSQFATLAPTDRLEGAVRRLLAGFQPDFPVIQDGRLVGMLTRSDLISALSHGRPTTVGEVMQRRFEAAAPDEPLDRAFIRLQGTECRCLPVLDGGVLVGLLTPENVGELLMVQAALEQAAASPRPLPTVPTDAAHGAVAPALGRSS